MADPVAWTFAAGGDYTEELAWLTDLLQAPTGGTQHRRLRQSPRTTLTFSALESGANRRWMDVLLRANSAGAWWSPVSIDARALTADVAAASSSLPVDMAAARFVDGGHALVVGTDPRRFEVLEIAASGVGGSTLTLAGTTANAWPAGTQVIPVRRARLAEMPQVGRFTADDSALVQFRFRLEEPLDTVAAMPGATYRSYPMFDAFAPAWTSDPVWVPERLTDVQDDDLATPFVADTAGVALGKVTMQYTLDTAAAIRIFREALFALAGRWSPAWVPSWTHDLRLAASVAGGQSYIDVEGPLLSTQPLAANHRDLRIELFDGTVLYRRISAVAAQSTTIDRLTLDAALPSAFTTAQVKMISFLTLSVQDSDTNMLRYFDAQTMQCELVWRELDHEL